MPDQTAHREPRLLRGANLADGEEIRAETRATKWYFFPGPIAALLLVLFLDYSATASMYSWLPAVPRLTPFFHEIPSAAGYSGASYVLGFFLLLTLGVLVLLAFRYYQWSRTVYAVTSSRVVVQKGVFSREFHEIPVSQVRGVDVRQSFLHRMFGFGTMRVYSEGGAKVGNEDWAGVPAPFKLQRDIENANQDISRGQSPPMAHPEVPARVRAPAEGS
jgi:membrane protein YdbS with pleckstrin-like domain